MNFFVRKPWDMHQSQHTPLEVYRQRKLHRRNFLRALGISGASVGLSTVLSGCSKPTDKEIEQAGEAPVPAAAENRYPAPSDERFTYGRPETRKRDAAEYTNFYEFSTRKDSWQYVERFQPDPWTFEVGGLCNKPRKFDMDDVYKTFQLEERAYRHRCVETWAMCVPWTGFPLRELLRQVEPQPAAKFVAFETFNRPSEAPGINNSPDNPWPYSEGLTVAEAMNELALLATGIYGEPMPKQHGAPIRLVVPWKYGFKSIKSIAKITLTDKQPSTFWNTLIPHEYGFEANVDPQVSHPRWSQAREWMLPDRSNRFDTVVYNGYGEFVGGLYS